MIKKIGEINKFSIIRIADEPIIIDYSSTPIIVENQNLHRALFENTKIKECIFINCELRNGAFVNSDFENIVFKNCNLILAEFFTLPSKVLR